MGRVEAVDDLGENRASGTEIDSVLRSVADAEAVDESGLEPGRLAAAAYGSDNPTVLVSEQDELVVHAAWSRAPSGAPVSLSCSRSSARGRLGTAAAAAVDHRIDHPVADLAMGRVPEPRLWRLPPGWPRARVVDHGPRLDDELPEPAVPSGVEIGASYPDRTSGGGAGQRRRSRIIRSRRRQTSSTSRPDGEPWSTQTVSSLRRAQGA